MWSTRINVSVCRPGEPGAREPRDDVARDVALHSLLHGAVPDCGPAGDRAGGGHPGPGLEPGGQHHPQPHSSDHGPADHRQPAGPLLRHPAGSPLPPPTPRHAGRGRQPPPPLCVRDGVGGDDLPLLPGQGPDYPGLPGPHLPPLPAGRSALAPPLHPGLAAVSVSLAAPHPPHQSPHQPRTPPHSPPRPPPQVTTADQARAFLAFRCDFKASM